jgi:hypothetical protein
MPIPSPISTKPRPLWAKMLITLGVILFIVAVPFGIAEGMYQMRVNKLNVAVEKIGNGALALIGGKEYYFYVHGGHFWDICVDNGPCPSVTRAWSSLVDASSGESYTKAAVIQELASDGYSINDGGRIIEGVGKGIKISASVSNLESEKTPPYTAPSGKMWQAIIINAYEL